MSKSKAGSPRRSRPDPPMTARVRQAAVTLFARNGYGSTGIRDIAREAGLTSATLYHYTSSKEELLVRIMVDGQTALNDAAEAELEGVSDPLHRLGTLVGTLVAAHATNPLSTRVIDTEVRSLGKGSEGRAHVVALRDKYESYWSDALRDGEAAGVMKVGDHHVTRLALLTMCTGMSNWYRRDAATDPEVFITGFVDLALGAVKARVGDRQANAKDLPPIAMDRVPVLLSEPEPAND